MGLRLAAQPHTQALYGTQTLQQASTSKKVILIGNKNLFRNEKYMQYIKKLKLCNFKRFEKLEIEFGQGINTIVGDNESGKSTILQAIELVSSGNRNRIESSGIEALLNKSSVKKFFSGEKLFNNLPNIHVEIFLNDESNSDIYGKNNSDGLNASGLHLVCEPNEDLAAEINEVLRSGENNFPYEFYIARFFTFNGEAYSGYRQLIKTLTIDSSKINSEYANKEYIKTIYDSAIDYPTRISLKNEYRQQKIQFRDDHLKTVNDSLGEYDFSVRSGSKANLETDLTLTQNEIPIDERGKGQQCFIKTEFALAKRSDKKNIDILLLEEPENHLSHLNMKRLINKISASHQNQIIIATHNSLVSTRLDLRKSILVNSSSEIPLKLKAVPESTAKFFMKAPDNNILEFVLSEKVILVEGDAEYMLMDALYTNETKRSLEQDCIHIISVGGTSFKRYMELAKALGIKTAVIRDNDEDYQKNCVDNYAGHVSDNIKVFSDQDNARYTFEVCIHADNEEICNELFSGGNIKKTPLDFMLANKSESSFRLADKKSNELIAPEYIKQAIKWINE